MSNEIEWVDGATHYVAKNHPLIGGLQSVEMYVSVERGSSDVWQFKYPGDEFWKPWVDSDSYKLAVMRVAVKRPEIDLFEGQLPEWAIAKNPHHYLVPGAQLLTKDGRRTGNAHVIMVVEKFYTDGEKTVIFEALTDAGNKINLTAGEIHSMFYIGDYLSAVGRVLKDFDRNKEFEVYPHI